MGPVLGDEALGKHLGYQEYNLKEEGHVLQEVRDIRTAVNDFIQNRSGCYGIQPDKDSVIVNFTALISGEKKFQHLKPDDITTFFHFRKGPEEFRIKLFEIFIKHAYPIREKILADKTQFITGGHLLALCEQLVTFKSIIPGLAYLESFGNFNGFENYCAYLKPLNSVLEKVFEALGGGYDSRQLRYVSFRERFKEEGFNCDFNRIDELCNGVKEDSVVVVKDILKTRHSLDSTFKMILFLLKKGARVNAYIVDDGSFYKTPLLLLLWAYEKELNDGQDISFSTLDLYLKFLISKGMDISQLKELIKRGKLSFHEVPLELMKDIDPNMQIGNQSALHNLASDISPTKNKKKFQRHVRVLQLLVSNKADRSCLYNGKTAAQILAAQFEEIYSLPKDLRAYYEKAKEVLVKLLEKGIDETDTILS